MAFQDSLAPTPVETRVRPSPSCGPSEAFEEQRRQWEEAALAQKRESLGLLAGGLAHDFNNLLVGMLTASDLLLHDLPEGSEQRQVAALIKKAAERATHLTRQMLVFAGKSKPERRRLALNAVVEEQRTLQGAGLPRNVRLLRELTPADPAVDADAGQLRQAIGHLIANAAEALEPHGGTVVLRTGVDGGWATLEVADTGVGLTSAELARIFDPFYTTKGRGRGLGLAHVLGIVRCHGGDVRATSVLGRGTTVRVVWPLATGPAPPAVAPPPAAVLVIDDEPVVRGVVARALLHHGYPTYTAASAQEGLSLYRSHRDAVRLVLLDIGLSSAEGGRLVADLVAVNRDVQIVLTSGSELHHALNLPETVRPVAYLAKPYTVHALLEVVGPLLAAAG